MSENKAAYYRMNFALSGLSAMVGGALTHPIDTAKVQMQMQRINYGCKKYQNIYHGMYLIAKEEGIRYGVCKGIVAQVIREGSYSSIRLGGYEPIKVELFGETDP